MADDLQRVHDELLRLMPEGASHTPDCPFCAEPGPDPHRQTAEESGMADAALTHDQHEALVASAVERAVAAAQETASAELDELRTRVDTLEAEKAAAVKTAADAEKALEDYKTKIEADRALAETAKVREAAVRELADHLDDDYFSQERVTRWAEMADEQFEELLETFTDGAIARLDSEDAALVVGLAGPERRAKVVELIEARSTREKANEEALNGGFRETAAFSGGTTPTARSGGGSAARRAFIGLPANA